MSDRITDVSAHQRSVSPRVALAALLLGAAAIGFAPVLTRMAMNRGLGPSATAMWRMAIASPIFWAHVLLHRGSPGRPAVRRALKRRDWLLLGIPGVLFAGDLAFWHWSIKFTTVANATLLANFAAIFVALAGWLWLRETLGVGFALGLVLALAGAAVLVRASFAVSTRHILGDGLGLITALFYAAYQLTIKRLRNRFGVTQILSASSVSSAVLLLAISLLSGEKLILTGLAIWGILVALGLVSHVGGQGLITYAFGHLPASFTSVSLLFQPVVAGAAAWVIFGESLSAVQIGGGVVVLIGIALARRCSGAAEKKSN